MICFHYKAVDINGKRFRGKYEGKDETALAVKLRESGLYLLKVRKFYSFKFMNKKTKLKDIAVFCRQLYSIHYSGVIISEALRIISEQCSKSIMKESIVKIKDSVTKGESLYNSMAAFTKIYPSFLLNMINIGEESGNLNLTLNQLSNYYENEHKIIQKLKTSVSYPVILFVLTILITVFLMVKVVPIFAGNLTSMGVELPFFTMIVLSSVTFLKTNVLLIAAVLIFSILSLKKHAGTLSGKMVTDKIKLKIPVLKHIFVKIIELRFAKVMFILLKSGTNLIKAFELVKNPINNYIFDKVIFTIIINVKEGISLTKAMKDSNFFSDFLISMISVGEETGNLEGMLEKCISFMDTDLNECIERSLSLLQPILMIFLAVMIGSVILSIMLPMFKLMDSIGA